MQIVSFRFFAWKVDPFVKKCIRLIPESATKVTIRHAHHGPEGIIHKVGPCQWSEITPINGRK